MVGRPPGPHEDTLAKLLPAALRLFLDEGGQALTPTRLHRETGVSRATIYRNWPDPADLIEVMVQRATRLPDEVSCSDDLRADLHREMDLLLGRFEHRPARAFFAACLEYGRRSDGMASTAQAFVAGILEPFRIVIADAVSRGEIDGDVDDLVAEVTGPLMLRHVILGERITTAKGRAAVDHFVDHHLPA